MLFLFAFRCVYIRPFLAHWSGCNSFPWHRVQVHGLYKSKEMAAFCDAKGIQQCFSAPYSQWQNGVAERHMRTVGEMSLAMLVHSGLPKRAWGWATLLACEVLNRSLAPRGTSSRSGVPREWSRLERWHNRALPTQAKALYPFGCLIFKHIPQELRNKLQPHAAPMVYLGIDGPSRSFLMGTLYDLFTTVAVEVTVVDCQ